MRIKKNNGFNGQGRANEKNVRDRNKLFGQS